MSRAAAWVAAGLAASALLASPQAGFGYSGVGRAAIERSGKVPATEDELDREIGELKRRLDAGDRQPQTAYRLAILRLNRPKGLDLSDARALLTKVLLADPGYEDALRLWTDLNPSDSELRRFLPALQERQRALPESPAHLWALARGQHRLGEYGAARQALTELERRWPEWGARASWLKAVIAGEREEAGEATEHFEAALVGLDDQTAELIWRSSFLVASRAEANRWGDLGEQARAEFLRGFWKRRDVFPLTPENERLAEHFQRLKRCREDYDLKSNGRSYLTMNDRFKDLSPDLPFYSSDVVYEYLSAVGPWLDHRGLVFVRHGEPERGVKTTTGVRAESWLYYRWTQTPLMFHFIDRRGVGEFVVTLNLAQATANNPLEDDPEVVVSSSGSFRDFRSLYASRATFHQLFQQMATSRSRYQVEEIIYQEASMMAAFLKEVWLDETSNLIDKDDLLPFAAYSANFRRDSDLVDTYVYYAIPEKELAKEGPKFEFDATVVIYDADWREELGSAEHHFRYERPPGKKPNKQDLLVGALELEALPPGRYKFAFQIRERHSDKIGVAKGGLTVDYYGPGWVDVSDLLLAESVTPSSQATRFDRHGHKVIPIPTRTLPQGREGKLYYEVYDLESGADGKNHYRVEYRILQIQQKPGIASKLFGIGMNIAYLFFPYQTFLAQAGLFGFDVATADPDKGLETWVEERHATPTDGVVSEVLDIDTTKYKKGVYQVYVTVKDHVSGSLSTRSLRFAVN